jgi:hypothetical protein
LSAQIFAKFDSSSATCSFVADHDVKMLKLSQLSFHPAGVSLMLPENASLSPCSSVMMPAFSWKMP